MLATLLLAAVVAAAPPEGTVQTTLSNGLEVTIVPDPSMPVVATQVWYHVGAANEDADSRGLAHLFEHMMFGATATYGRGEYSKFVTSVGGYDNAFTSEDETVYVSQVPPEAYEGILRREADRMRGLAITQDNLDNEKKIVTEELRLRTENDPMARLLVKAQQALLGTHPYAFDPSGSKEDVAHATVAGCRAFYDRHYRPNLAHLVVVGPVDPAAAMAVVTDAFGSLPPGGEATADVPALYGWPFPDTLALTEDIPPVEVALEAVVLPPAGAHDDWALEVLIEMLARRSVDPVREIVVRRRNKAIEAGVETLRMRRGGGIVFYSASLPYRRKATAFKVLDQAIAELDRMEWLTEDALASAKRKVLLHEYGWRRYADALASSIGAERWWRGDASIAFARTARIDEVTKDGVAAAWRRYVRDGTKIRVYVKPERVPFYIRMFGWLYPLFS